MTLVVITGATRGIGRAAAVELAKRGLEVAVVGRERERVDAVAGEAEATGGGAAVHRHVADLALMAEVRALAEELRQRHKRIDVLANNAGALFATRKVTSEGFEQTLALNHLAPFLLTNLLLGQLRASAPARVVNVASEAHRIGWTVDVADLYDLGGYGPIGGVRAYGKTKLMDILFTFELARRLEGAGVTANCLCPGLVATNLPADQPVAVSAGRLLSRTPFMRTPEQGARMSVKLATDPGLEGVTGRFFTSTALARPLPAIPALRDGELQRRLWEGMAERCGLAGDG